MQIAVPLIKMTIADKLRLLEEILDSLSQAPGNIPSPSWHAAVLDTRDQKAQEGSAKFHNWAEAQKQIREHTRCKS